VLTNKEDQNICELDFGYARMWTFNYFAIVQNEVKVAKLIETTPTPFKVGIGIRSGISSCINIQS
jgi:hypothetical protein